MLANNLSEDQFKHTKKFLSHDLSEKIREESPVEDMTDDPISMTGYDSDEDMDDYTEYDTQENYCDLNEEIMTDYTDYRDQLPQQITLTDRQKADIDESFQLMRSKGIYPYEYMDSFDRFTEMKLPEMEKFYSTLTEKNISKEEYEHAQHVFKHFNMTNLQDYHNFYLLTDILLLADVWESFRELCQQYYGLDAARFYTSPSNCIRFWIVYLWIGKIMFII